ncbi:MAG: response regulator [Roseibium sp.]|uniref:sigma-54-dependent transcriptional regulator n=1 Tax=Roseibium sp. TaxID=1936156 RepID=UPI00262B77F9|nr:response regulator [Roseibium sp.]MCV0428313.1 response regulator [Roseibium sp.]
MNNTVLLVEDDPVLRRSIAQSLFFERIEVIEAGAYVVAKDHVSKDLDGVILTDIRMEGKDGFELLKFAQEVDPELPVIMLTGEGDVPMAIHAIRNGAFEFLEKPCHPDKLLRVLRQALKHRELVLQNRELQEKLTRRDAAAIKFPGKSLVIRLFRDELRKLSKLPVNIHLWGEAGAGRFLAAKCLCELSSQSNKVTDCNLRDCDASLFDSLSNLDTPHCAIFKNIETASPNQQELLAALIDKKPNFRVVTTSSSSIEDIPDEQLCRSLFFHMSVAQLEVPALRKRPEDVLPVFQSMLQQQAEAMQQPVPELSSEKIAAITERMWNGNLAELRQYAQRVLLDLDNDDAANDPVGLSDRLNAYEKTILIDTLRRHKGKTAAVASELAIPLKTLYDRLSRHGLKSSRFRD